MIAHESSVGNGTRPLQDFVTSNKIYYEAWAEAERVVYSKRVVAAVKASEEQAPKDTRGVSDETLENLKTLLELFRSVDTDGGGDLDRTELAEMFKTMYRKVST